jgi:hypothetical protein
MGFDAHFNRTARFLSDCGVGVVTDFMPRQSKPSSKSNLPWLVRRVEVSNLIR